MDNVIDATHRFPQTNEGRQKVTPLDRLRQSPRTTRSDAILLAVRLGEIAQKLTPSRPKDTAKAWFEMLWHGERWEKRKRYVLFPGEDAPEPIASNGADWAALIEQAVKSRFPDDSSTAEKERAVAVRDILRGTSLMPSPHATPLRAENAQSLMRILTGKICAAIEDETDLTHLWEVLESTPFAIHSYDFERPDHADQDSDDPMIAAMRAMDRYDGDVYSLGPLGDASKLAASVSRFRYRQRDTASYRFEITTRRDDLDWSIPIMRLGLCGHSRKGRIFVIPQDFLSDLPFDQEFEDEEKTIEDRIPEWLVAKGILPSQWKFKNLPEMKYDAELGYGWKSFDSELAQQIWLEVRPKDDGSVGIWITLEAPDWSYCYPRLTGIDTLRLMPSRGDQFRFLPMHLGDLFYEYLEWPTRDPEFMIDGKIPNGGVSGLVDIEANELPEIEGWLDDSDNHELQDFLFRKRPGVRFCPHFALEEDVPPPCESETVAASLFANAGCEAPERIGRRLLEQANVIGLNGLAFHAALLGHHRARIEQMFT